MEYSIREVSGMAGVSARTLRYYDEIGLLKPLYISDAGYRYYGEKELDLLQQILFYRERDFDLKSIQKILYQDSFDVMNALEEHLLELENRRRQIDLLIHTVKQTIRSMKGECVMSDKEKFQAFKEKMVKENEEKYGTEVRERFGDEQMDASNQKILNMSEAEYESFQNLGAEINERLEECVRTGASKESEAAKEIVRLHKKWLCQTWKQYSANAHKALAQSYTQDKRFLEYYDKNVTGCGELLKQAVDFWADKI